MGKIIGALAIGFAFRYQVLMPRSDIPFIQSFIRKLPTLCVIGGYGNGFLYGFLTYMSCLDKVETEKKLHQVKELPAKFYPLQMDPSYEVPKDAVTFGGVWIYLWGGLAMVGYTFSIVGCITIGWHTKKILKAQRSRFLHQEVFRSLVLQVNRSSFKFPYQL